MKFRRASSLLSLSELKLSRAAAKSCSFFPLDELVRICRHRYHCTDGLSGDFLDEVQGRLQIAGFMRQDINPVTFAYWRLYQAVFDDGYMDGYLQRELEVLLSNEVYEQLRKFTESETKDIKMALDKNLTLDEQKVIELRFGLKQYVLPMGDQKIAKQLKTNQGAILLHLHSGLKALKLPGALPRYSWLATYNEK